MYLHCSIVRVCHCTEGKQRSRRHYTERCLYFIPEEIFHALALYSMSRSSFYTTQLNRTLSSSFLHVLPEGTFVFFFLRFSYSMGHYSLFVHLLPAIGSIRCPEILKSNFTAGTSGFIKITLAFVCLFWYTQVLLAKYCDTLRTNGATKSQEFCDSLAIS